MGFSYFLDDSCYKTTSESIQVSEDEDGLDLVKDDSLRHQQRTTCGSRHENYAAAIFIIGQRMSGIGIREHQGSHRWHVFLIHNSIKLLDLLYFDSMIHYLQYIDFNEMTMDL